jgi:hypothetical protein
MRSLWISSREQQILFALLSLTFCPYDRQYQKKTGVLVGYYTWTEESLVLIFLVCRGVQMCLHSSSLFPVCGSTKLCCYSCVVPAKF